MARDYEDIRNLDDLSDDELRGVVMEQLRDDTALDADDITVTVSNGEVHLAGRVGTEAERRIAERIVDDLIGIDRLRNELLVDPIRRGQSPEPMDEHMAAEDAAEGRLLGDRPVPFEPTAEHLDDELDEEDRAFGSTDVQTTIEKGTAWIPPQRPTPEGLDGENPDRPSRSDDH